MYLKQSRSSSQELFRDFSFRFFTTRRAINGISLGNEQVSKKKRFSQNLEIPAFTSTTFDPDGLTGPVTTFRKAVGPVMLREYLRESSRPGKTTHRSTESRPGNKAIFNLKNKKTKVRGATRGLPRRSPILVLLLPKHA